MKLCIECVSSHKNHEIRDADDVQKEAQIQKKKLESVIEEIKNHREEVESSLKASKKTVITVLAQEFDKVRDTIKEREREILSKVESVYETRKKGLIGKALEKDDILREKYELKIADLKTGMNKRFFRTLAKLEKKGIIHEPRDIDHDIKVTEAECISAIEQLGSLLSFRIQNTYFDVPDILNDSNTNIIQVYEPPQPLENLLYFKAQDRQSLTVDPRYSFSSESSFLDYSLLKKTMILSFNCYGDDFSQEHFNAMKRVYTFCDKVSNLRLSFIKTVVGYQQN